MYAYLEWSLFSSLTQLVYFLVDVYLHYYGRCVFTLLRYHSNVNTHLPENKQVVLD